MERVIKVFSAISQRCCFPFSMPTNDPIEPGNKSSLDITSFQNPIEPDDSRFLQLKITVTESDTLSLNNNYIITPSGLVTSERFSYGDGCVYAGSLYSEDNKVVNDIILPQNERGIGKRHFVIEHRGYPHAFYLIKDLGEGMGTFIRISKPLILQTNYIISFGDSHMIVSIDSYSPPSLVLRFIDGPKINQKYKFAQNDSPITIGRMADCVIKFDDNSLSRYHTIITYKDRWVINDGDGRRSSTNGTWLFVEDFFEIHDEMVFKAGESTFKCQLSLEKREKL